CALPIFLVVSGIALWVYSGIFTVVALTLIGLNNLFVTRWKGERTANYVNIAIALLVVLSYLSEEWLPLGTETSITTNFVFVFMAIAFVLGLLWLLVIYYEHILRWALNHRWKFMAIPILTLLWGMIAWQGMDKNLGFVANGFESIGWKSFKETGFWQKSTKMFPGMGQEFMPSLNEGSFLLMPTTMPHTGIEQNLQYI